MSDNAPRGKPRFGEKGWQTRRSNHSARQHRAEQRALSRRKELEILLRQAEQEARSWGELVKAIREYKGWSRAMLLSNYQCARDERFPDDEQMEIPGEAWIARVERGEVLRTDRRVIDLICQVLECSEEQRVKVLSLASNTLFAVQSDEPDAEAEFLICVSNWLYEDPTVKPMIRTLLKDRRTYTLSRPEIFEIHFEVLEVVKTHGIGGEERIDRKDGRPKL